MNDNRRTLSLLLAVAGVRLLIHLLVGEGYGCFRDEFYYLACARNLDWGYVDHPPLSVLLLRLWTAIAGESIVAIRLLPALAGAATVFLAGRIAGQLGGGLFARVLATVASLAAPIYLGVSGYVSMNAFDVLIWAAAASLLIRILDSGPSRLWLLLGVLLGLGLLNKLSVLWLGAGLLLGLVLSAEGRRHLRTPWPWLAGAAAGLVFLPHVLWQVANGWPTLEFIRNASSDKMVEVAPLRYLLSQVWPMNPLNLPVWLSGLGYLLLSPRTRRYRILGITYLAVGAILILNGTSRVGYLAPAYTMLLGAGGVVLERAFRMRGGLPARVAALGLLAASGGVLAPLALPILPVESYLRYAAALGFAPSTEERKQLAELPQHYADMHGWESIVEQVDRVYRGLPEEDRARAVIFTYNYGEAGALELLGRPKGLPPVLSGHNNYWLWGPRGATGEVVMIIGGSEEDHRRRYAAVEPAGRTDCGYCMPYENGQTIWVARGLREPVEAVWPRVKHYD